MKCGWMQGTPVPRRLASAAVATSGCMMSALSLRAATLTTRLHDPHIDGASVATTIEDMRGLGKSTRRAECGSVQMCADFLKAE